jgi:hypothetical protein
MMPLRRCGAGHLRTGVIINQLGRWRYRCLWFQPLLIPCLDPTYRQPDVLAFAGVTGRTPLEYAGTAANGLNSLGGW